jgi:hypothetical protein
MAAPHFDGYGLHAADCGCPRCEAGFRPTATQRMNARIWALQRGQQAASTRKLVEQHERHRRELERTEREAQKLKAFRPPTPEERIELEAIRRQMFGGKS